MTVSTAQFTIFCGSFLRSEKITLIMSSGLIFTEVGKSQDISAFTASIWTIVFFKSFFILKENVWNDYGRTGVVKCLVKMVENLYSFSTATNPVSSFH